MVDQEKERGFTVTDKRGASREPAPSSRQEDTQQAASYGQQTATQQGQASREDASPLLPEADFMTLIFSLYTHGQINLGIIPDPMSRQTMKDLVQAKYNIDILAILQEKTQGNLSKEEEQALEQMLYELRMSYVQST